ncbi:multicomponent Na+:H+ antiporter subunit C [Micromonospora nigra]|uniref:Multicomponent Na+:H+ antiporter subunit C n=1 Tax=Micromonospora nigra TaxID=145857 RepID=A0A1C6RG48_9ACTN|nr:multicomponent Na+:H+ antiporter subunit C [Micromonospora nigra]
MSAALVTGVLVAAGVFLLLRPGQLRVVLGFVLLGHAVNVLLLAAGGLQRRTSALEGPAPDAADPLPQAFVLTAIVITFGITVHLLGLLRRDPAAPGPHADGPGGPGPSAGRPRGPGPDADSPRGPGSDADSPRGPGTGAPPAADGAPRTAAGGGPEPGPASRHDGTDAGTGGGRP